MKNQYEVTPEDISEMLPIAEFRVAISEVDAELITLYISIHGSETAGYIGDVIEYFSEERSTSYTGYGPRQFYEVHERTNIYSTANEAAEEAYKLAKIRADENNMSVYVFNIVI